MGKLSNAVLDYFDDNARFANLFNGSLFGGRNVVNPQDLAEGSEVYPDEDPRVQKTYKKQIKRIKRHNQDQNLLKTSEERMCGLRQEDRLDPTYTLCLYHGKEKWTGLRSLKESSKEKMKKG